MVTLAKVWAWLHARFESSLHSCSPPLSRYWPNSTSWDRIQRFNRTFPRAKSPNTNGPATSFPEPFVTIGSICTGTVQLRQARGGHGLSGRPPTAISSQPTGAEIEIDEEFVGNMPSRINLEPGRHTIVLRKKGFAEWNRVVRSTIRERLNPSLGTRRSCAVVSGPEGRG